METTNHMEDSSVSDVPTAPNAWEQGIDEAIQAMPQSPSAQYDFERLVRLIWRFRQEGGCPWDIKQTHASITKHFIEEAYEAVDALERGKTNEVVEELGDVLEQVVLHAQIARDEGEFSIEDVCRALAHKLIFRHPHVFGAYPEELLGESREDKASDARSTAMQDNSGMLDASGKNSRASQEASDTNSSYTAKTADDVMGIWSEVKRRERAQKEDEEHEQIWILDSIPIHLPALMQAQKIQARLEEYGLELTGTHSLLETQGFNELRARLEDESVPFEKKQDMFARALCELIGIARKAHIDAESALRKTMADARVKMKRTEAHVASRGKTLESISSKELLSIWESARASVCTDDGTMNSKLDTSNLTQETSQGYTSDEQSFKQQ